ncbi:MAG: chorismate mutase [Bacteroidota bacterium]
MTLDDLRKQIDSLDDQVLQLLTQRMEVVKQVGELKKQNRAIVYRPEREKAIVDRLYAQSKGLLSRPAIEAIFLEIFAVSRNIELPERVAYLGPEGSFTHQAAESRFGAMSEYIGLTSIRSVFESVASERVRFGVVPIENNQAGDVVETLDYLEEFDIKIAAEVPMAIHFGFATLADEVHAVKTLYSRDLGFRQCRKFIRDYFGEDARLVSVSSTSEAARLAAADPTAAALCSTMAARLHQLPILFHNVEDSDENQTRFLILSRHFTNQPSGADKTSVIAYVADDPGSLATLLDHFREAEINLTKIESRPAREGRGFRYWFFIECEGHEDQPAFAALLQSYGASLRSLGSYLRLI